MSEQSADNSANDIAIVGMACRFPGARNIDEFWENLRNGVESISDLSEREVDQYQTQSNSLPPNYVRAAAILEDADLFDADFFDMPPREAQLTDPQHRIFLECAWEALENAGYHAEQYNGLIGVYAGAGFNSYLAYQIEVNKGALVSMGHLQALISNDKDYLTSRVSYKLNLEGPSLTAQTACSSALASIYLAYQGLLTYQCDMALAGGVSVKCPQNAGYLYLEDGVLSPDGHTRSFDAGARGTIFGSGVGIVVLKRLSDAVADGDSVYAIIKGVAMNNDGSSKIGYTAPSSQGLSRVVTMAIESAGIDASTISYIEAHGTATALGDPIEIAGLNRAFQGRQGRAVCAIGSVKTNFGHLTSAAGAAGLIKTVLALKNRQIPPSLHFNKPNPDIDWDHSPFYVNTALSEWKRTNSPRRAGVNSIGIGGTNVHVILEEAPEFSASHFSKWPRQVLLLSAKTESALERLTIRMASHFEQRPDENLADAAFTLQRGRKRFTNRRMLTCRDATEAVEKLHRPDGVGVFTNPGAEQDRPVVFMFPGQGAQHLGMGEFLYKRSSVFRNELDRCSTLLKPELGVDPRDLLYRTSDADAGAADRLRQTAFAQPALFAVEYALAKLFISLGVSPAAMIGHSLGEYVAACLAGVFSLEDSLALVCARGRLMQNLPPGAMLALTLPAAELHRLPLHRTLSLAASNSPTQCVVSGAAQDIDGLESWLSQAGIKHRRLNTSHAFHSAMMDGILDAFGKEVAGVRLMAPQIPYVSNVTGSWITSAEATDPAYWVRHLRSTVLFFEGVSLLFQENRPVFVELGPGDTLTSLVKGVLKDYSPSEISAVMGWVRDDDDASERFLRGLGFLWLHGAPVSWGALHAGDHRRRVALPTYPFERKRYWVVAEPQPESQRRFEGESDPGKWLYVPAWKRTGHPLERRSGEETAGRKVWLIFADGSEAGAAIVERLRKNDNHKQIVITAGGSYREEVDEGRFTLRADSRQDYSSLFRRLKSSNMSPDYTLYLWNLGGGGTDVFFSLLYLAQALGEASFSSEHVLFIVSDGTERIESADVIRPEKCLIKGLCRVLPQEHADIWCRHFDVAYPTTDDARRRMAEWLVSDMLSGASEEFIALRGSHRWVPVFESIETDPQRGEARLRERGVYLITGGLGEIGLALAAFLAQKFKARLALTDWREAPPRSEWDEWIMARGEDENISRRILRVREMEAAGAEVMVMDADVADSARMNEVVAEVYQRFGTIHGVIHAAGVHGGGLLQVMDRNTVHEALRAKVQGTDAVANAVGKGALDFMALCSSLATVVGGVGQADYCAANAYQDAWALAAASRGEKVVVINWDDWKEAGNVVCASAGLRNGATPPGITSAEGAQVFLRALGSVDEQIVVSTYDLPHRLEARSLRSDPGLPKPLDRTQIQPDLRELKELSNGYVNPRNELEAEVLQIWQEVLGTQGCGIHSDFFELGGNSLAGIQVVSHVRQHFQIEFSLESLFESPSPSGMAEIISRRLAEGTS